MKYLALTWLFSLGLCAAEITTGEVGGAKFMIAEPDEWGGKLVLLAHGLRSEDQPLKADFTIDNQFVEPLLDGGWAVATTSYRRNGWIIEDAIEDLKNLREHIESSKGKIDCCILVGSSMGGLIGTLVAEGDTNGIQGVVAIGAYLGDRETGSFYETLSWKPKIPILFLTNESELDHALHYRTQAGDEWTALWRVKRPGHANVSSAERFASVNAMHQWIEGTPPEKEKDATAGAPARTSTAAKSEGARTGKITFVSATLGNLSSDLVAADLEALGAKTGDKVIAKSTEAELPATVCNYRTDVPEGEAAVYITPNGWVAIVVNEGNAAAALKVGLGDPVTLSPAPPAQETSSEPDSASVKSE